MRRIGLPRPLKELFKAEAEARRPQEALALLLGQDRGGQVEICDLFIASNKSNLPTEAFRLDPRDWREARLRAQEIGLDLVGSLHSHPAGGLSPSEADRLGLLQLFPEGKSWPYFICSPADGPDWKWACWVMIDANLFPVEVYEI